MAAEIAYECVARPHQSGGDADKLTIHDGQWAYCPCDAKAEGHEWKPTGGRPLFTFAKRSSQASEPRKRGAR